MDRILKMKNVQRGRTFRETAIPRHPRFSKTSPFLNSRRLMTSRELDLDKFLSTFSKAGSLTARQFKGIKKWVHPIKKICNKKLRIKLTNPNVKFRLPFWPLGFSPFIKSIVVKSCKTLMGKIPKSSFVTWSSSREENIWKLVTPSLKYIGGSITLKSVIDFVYACLALQTPKFMATVSILWFNVGRCRRNKILWNVFLFIGQIKFKNLSTYLLTWEE